MLEAARTGPFATDGGSHCSGRAPGAVKWFTLPSPHDGVVQSSLQLWLSPAVSHCSTTLFATRRHRTRTGTSTSSVVVVRVAVVALLGVGRRRA
jgi:hypothetical protein